MARPDLSRLSSEEKDALILSLLDRVATLEAKLGQPAKTPDNSSLPPSRGQKANRAPRSKKPRRPRDGPGVTRALCTDPEHIVDCYAQACAHCGTAVTAAGQSLRHAYDHRPAAAAAGGHPRAALRPALPQLPAAGGRVRGAPPKTLPPGSPFGPSIVTLLAYLSHHHAVGYDRLSRLMAELFGLPISEGAIANALRRANQPLDRAAAAIVERLRSAAVIGCDETGARLTTADLGTRMGWEWVLVSGRAVLHRIRPSRGRGVITEVLREHRPRCSVSDHSGAQQGHADAHQVCLAHVLRDVQYAVDAGEAGFAPALRRLLRALPISDHSLWPLTTA